jgi:hypothetical protein
MGNRTTNTPKTQPPLGLLKRKSFFMSLVVDLLKNPKRIAFSVFRYGFKNPALFF